MAYLYTRQIIIDLGPQNKESFYDEEIYSDSYPSLNMDHLRNTVTIHQYAVSDDLCDPSEDLRYLQFVIDAPDKEKVYIDTWNVDEWRDDKKLATYFEGVPSEVLRIIHEALSGNETYDFTGEVDSYFDEDGWRCELVQTEGAHQVPFDEDELESYDLDRFYGIWVIHKHGEIDDSILKDIPSDEVDPRLTEEEKENLEYTAGVDLDFEEDGMTLLERLMGGEICEDYDDEYEIFGYVTATIDSDENDDEDFEEDEE